MVIASSAGICEMDLLIRVGDGSRVVVVGDSLAKREMGP